MRSRTSRAGPRAAPVGADHTHAGGSGPCRGGTVRHKKKRKSPNPLLTASAPARVSLTASTLVGSSHTGFQATCPLNLRVRVAADRVRKGGGVMLHVQVAATTNAPGADPERSCPSELHPSYSHQALCLRCFPETPLLSLVLSRITPTVAGDRSSL